MPDRARDDASLGLLWSSFGRRLAVAGGALVALVSLLHHVPLGITTLRAGAAFLAVSLGSRLGWLALDRSLAGDAEGARRAER
jgi:hypothetical protein